MGSRDQLNGCLLGCAVGDAIGLPYEGMKPSRVSRLIQKPLRHRFLFGRGMVSDDTDHSIFVAQALVYSSTDEKQFANNLARRLRCWLLCLPAGVGLATLRSCLKLWVGFSPDRSGVFSAGNGAAMRSAVIGVFHKDDEKRRKAFTSASTRITHADPKADMGAQAVASIAAQLARIGGSRPQLSDLRELLIAAGNGDEWKDTISRTLSACESGDIQKALASGADRKGVSGYVFHTLPVAISGWYIHHGDFRSTVESVVSLGGDTDTVAAIAGSLAGVVVGAKGIPQEWVNGILDCPHNPKLIAKLSSSLAGGQQKNYPFSWMLFPRGIVFTSTVLAHGFLRLLPPY